MGYQHLAALALALSSTGLFAAEEPVCRYCPEPGGTTGEVRFGIGFIDQTEPSPVFYNPWGENGNYPLLWAGYSERDDTNGHFDADIRIEGGDSAAFNAKSGRQGQYGIFVSYDKLTVHRAPGAKTPYTQVDDYLALPGSMGLPGSWTHSASTEFMTSLAGAVHPAELGAAHENLAIGLSVDSGRWHYATRLSQRETRSRRPLGGMIGDGYTVAQVAILAVPQTHMTQDFQASAELVGDSSRNLSIGYLGSRFSNKHNHISWDNPYNTYTTIPTGTLALAPDNTFHQFYVQGRQRLSSTSQTSFRLAYSSYLQDDAFLPASTSTTIILPRISPDAQIDSWIGDLRYNKQFTDSFSMAAHYAYEDQSNHTPRSTYVYAVGDTSTTYIASNEPYSFRKQRISVTADYKLPDLQRIHAGASGGMQDRTYLEVEHSEEGNAWLEYRWQPQAAPDLALRIEGQLRRVDDYQANPTENPFLRKYYLADRNAQRISLRSHYQSERGWDLGLQAGYTMHGYPDSDLGLQETIEHNAQLDLGIPVAARLVLSGFVGWQGARTEQIGNDGISDWTATQRDFTLSGGLQLQWRSANERWEHTLGWNGLFYRGEINVADTDYPDLTGTNHQVVLTSRYRYADDVDLELQIANYQHFEDDWAREYIAPNSLDQVLGLGEGVANYRLWTTYLSVRQRF